MALQGEELVSNEIGAKLEFLDNRLRLNAAVFTSDYDPRVRQTGGVNQCDAPNVLNPVPYRLGGGNCPADTWFGGQNGLAPSAGLPWFFYDNSPGTLDGYEVELTATPVENLLIDFSFGHNEYENTNNDPAPTNFTYVAPGYLSQPEYTSSLGFQYDGAARQRRSADASPRRVLSVRAAHGIGGRATGRSGRHRQYLPARSAFLPTRS